MSRIPTARLLCAAGVAGLACTAGTAPVVTFKATGLFSAPGTVTLKRCSLSNHYRCIADPDLALGPDVLHFGGQAKPITGSARMSYGAHGPVTLPPAASASSGA